MSIIDQASDASELRDALLSVIDDPNRVSVGDSVRDLHSSDLSRHRPRRPDVVVFAETTDEVVAVLKLANSRRVPVVPYGAGTSTDGHIIPIRGGITLDVSRMDRCIALRPDDHIITVEPGMARSAVNRLAGEHGLFFPVDPGADASIGGMVGTNASGTTTVRYGDTRHQILGLKVVLADGRVIRTGGLTVKSSAGYDLGQIFIGAEGTLGVVVEVTLRLYAIPDHIVAARASFADLEGACTAARAIASLGSSLTRVELLDGESVRAVNAFSGTELEESPSLFLEFGGNKGAVDEDVAFAQSVAEESGLRSFQLETDNTARVRLWQARHDITFAYADRYPGAGSMIATDVCVPISKMPEAIHNARRVAEKLGIDAAVVGHVGDGNFHVVYVFNRESDADVAMAIRFEAELVKHALANGGTCTGEHGIGMGKRDHLAEEHGDIIPIMRGIKNQLDPHGILNPGKLLPDLD